MATAGKLTLRKKEFRNLGQSKEIQAADESVIDIDLAFNAIE